MYSAYTSFLQKRSSTDIISKEESSSSQCLIDRKVAFFAAAVLAIIAVLALSGYLFPDYSGLDWVRTVFVNNSVLVLGASILTGLSIGSFLIGYLQPPSNKVEESIYLTDNEQEDAITVEEEEPGDSIVSKPQKKVLSSIFMKECIINEQKWDLTVRFEGPGNKIHLVAEEFFNHVCIYPKEKIDDPLEYLKSCLETEVKFVEDKFNDIKVLLICNYPNIGAVSNILNRKTKGLSKGPVGFTKYQKEEKVSIDQIKQTLMR